MTLPLENNYTSSAEPLPNPAARPSYDADGNLVSDGTRTCSWSAAGRLTQAATASRRYECACDHLGRRIRRAEYRRAGNGWTLAEVRVYAYDG